MPPIITATIASFLWFLAIDSLWLFVIAKDFYRNALGHLLAENFNVLGAIFYPLYILAVAYFVLSPALNSNLSLAKVALNGALFGAICYATYDLTNLATLKDWPLNITIIDIIWGAVLTSATSTIGIMVARYFVK